MRRILVENARRKQRRQARRRPRAACDLDADVLAADQPPEDLLALDEALTRLAADDPQAAQLVQLRYFAGLSIPEAAEALGISPRTADRLWAFARAWLRQEIDGDGRTADLLKKPISWRDSARDRRIVYGGNSRPAEEP